MKINNKSHATVHASLSRDPANVLKLMAAIVTYPLLLTAFSLAKFISLIVKNQMLENFISWAGDLIKFQFGPNSTDLVAPTEDSLPPEDALGTDETSGDIQIANKQLPNLTENSVEMVNEEMPTIPLEFQSADEVEDFPEGLDLIPSPEQPEDLEENFSADSNFMPLPDSLENGPENLSEDLDISQPKDGAKSFIAKSPDLQEDKAENLGALSLFGQSGNEFEGFPTELNDHRPPDQLEGGGEDFFTELLDPLTDESADFCINFSAPLSPEQSGDVVEDFSAYPDATSLPD